MARMAATTMSCLVRHRRYRVALEATARRARSSNVTPSYPSSVSSSVTVARMALSRSGSRGRPGGRAPCPDIDTIRIVSVLAVRWWLSSRRRRGGRALVRGWVAVAVRGSGRLWTAESGHEAAVRAGRQGQRGADRFSDVLDQGEPQAQAASASGGPGVGAAVEGFDQLSGFFLVAQ